MTITFPGGVAVEAQLGDLTLRTDQPVKSGGGGTAPSPFDLFLGSIGTCAGFYALRFCQERELATEGLGVAMSWSRSAESGLIDQIHLDLTLPKDFPEKYRTAILRAVDQCAVKKHLVHPPAISVEARPLAG
jgi:ribosomal protein S12 methylthiotransferase accessory factor